MRLIPLLLCLVVAAGGCSKKDKAGGPGDKAPSSKPATKNVEPPKGQSRPASPEARVQEALGKYPTELGLLRKHPWSRTPSPAVLSAARKVFCGVGHDGAPDVSRRVQFADMSQAQVKGLVGNPSQKRTTAGGTVWTYRYPAPEGATVANLLFRNGRVLDVGTELAGL
jgi:hypothetical protein